MHTTTTLAVFCYIFLSTVTANSIRERIRQLENEGHDLSHIEQANIRRVVSQNIDIEPLAGENSYNDTNSNENGNSSPRCRSCATNREEQKLRRIEAIKRKISHALNLDLANMPNATGVKLPKVPSFLRLMERYEEETNTPNQEQMEYEDEEEEFGQPERTYTFAKRPPAHLELEVPNVSFFQIPAMVGKMPYKALLWLYIKPSDSIALNITEIKLYAVRPPETPGGPPVRRFLSKKRRHFDNLIGWQHFNVLSEVLRWTADPRHNYGIVAEAFDTNGNNLIVLPPVVGIDEEYIPLLDIRTTLRVTRRSKRSAAVSLICDANHQYDACCRYPIIVDFLDFGWDFVIAPNRYRAYYCEGECESENLGANNHAHLVQQTNTGRANAGPCCTPTRMSKLPMLYWDTDQSVQYILLTNMRVERCGCA